MGFRVSLNDTNGSHMQCLLTVAPAPVIPFGGFALLTRVRLRLAMYRRYGYNFLFFLIKISTLFYQSIQEVIKFCVQSKKLKRFYVEFILFFKKVLDSSGGGGCYTLLQCSIFGGKGVFELEHIEESREDEKNDWYMSGLLC